MCAPIDSTPTDEARRKATRPKPRRVSLLPERDDGGGGGRPRRGREAKCQGKLHDPSTGGVFGASSGSLARSIRRTGRRKITCTRPSPGTGGRGGVGDGPINQDVPFPHRAAPDPSRCCSRPHDELHVSRLPRRGSGLISPPLLNSLFLAHLYPKSFGTEKGGGNFALTVYVCRERETESARTGWGGASRTKHAMRSPCTATCKLLANFKARSVKKQTEIEREGGGEASALLHAHRRHPSPALPSSLLTAHLSLLTRVSSAIPKHGKVPCTVTVLASRFF